MQCLKKYVRLNIEEGNIAQLTCPDAACKITGHLSRRDIELLATPTLLRRYVRLSFERGKFDKLLLLFLTLTLVTIARGSVSTTLGS